MPVGARVYAVLKTTSTEVHVLGFGVLAGYFHKPGEKPADAAYVRALLSHPDMPPSPHDDIDETTMTAEQLQAHADTINTTPLFLNPRIDLDGGGVAWGFECWWGPEAEFALTAGNRRHVHVEAVRDGAGHCAGYRYRRPEDPVAAVDQRRRAPAVMEP